MVSAHRRNTKHDDYRRHLSLLTFLPTSRRKTQTHSFCYDCIIKWSKQENSCPLCKKEFKYVEKIPKVSQFDLF
jgi:predicted amidophosphoribosyltransferase